MVIKYRKHKFDTVIPNKSKGSLMPVIDNKSIYILCTYCPIVNALHSPLEHPNSSASHLLLLSTAACTEIPNKPLYESLPPKGATVN